MAAISSVSMAADKISLSRVKKREWLVRSSNNDVLWRNFAWFLRLSSPCRPYDQTDRHAGCQAQQLTRKDGYWDISPIQNTMIKTSMA
jgi:hypothetical protein